MSLYKRKNKHSELTTKAGRPTKKTMHEKALEKLEEVKALTKDKPIYFAKKGEGEFKPKLKEKIYVNKYTKVEGHFVSENNGVTIIKTLSGREYFAPSHEFDVR